MHACHAGVHICVRACVRVRACVCVRACVHACIHRHACMQVWQQHDEDKQAEVERKLRRAIYEKVMLAAGDPLVGGVCWHLKQLAERLVRIWSPTGLLLHPSVLQDYIRAEQIKGQIDGVPQSRPGGEAQSRLNAGRNESEMK